MPRRQWTSVSLDEIIDRIKKSALCSKEINLSSKESLLEELDIRMQKLLSLVNNIYRKPTDMIFLVMYDIENNKVRGLVAKYLIAQGCLRIQNSIFIADTTSERCDSIKSDLAEVQASYDNHDSILIVPLATSNVESIHIIGRTLDLDLVLKNRSTFFF